MIEKVTELLARLTRAGATFHLEPVPWGGIRVHTWAADERWVVDIGADGRVESEVFRSVSVGEGDASLEGLFGRMRKAWTQAAAELGFRFEAPLVLRGAPECSCCGWLPDFGGPRGTAILSREDPPAAHDAVVRLGYYLSYLNPRYYESYDAACFQETLRDWGWYGPESMRPAWLDPRGA